jgi:hypothetical protein
MSTLTSNRMMTMINRYGFTVTLIKPTYGAYDPATGAVGTGTTTSYTVKSYFADYMLSELGNDSIVMGDRKVVFPYLDTSGVALPEPDVEDSISGNGDTVKIVSVQKLYSGNSLVCYICQVRE